MPIPTLQENGFLPPGLYLADLDEDRWNAWLDFFSSVKYREGEWKGVVEVRLR